MYLLVRKADIRCFRAVGRAKKCKNACNAQVLAGEYRCNLRYMSIVLPKMVHACIHFNVDGDWLSKTV